MKTMTGTAAAAFMILALTACGGGSDEGKMEEPKGVIPEHMIEGMEKADNVENVLDQAKQERLDKADDQ